MSSTAVLRFIVVFFKDEIISLRQVEALPNAIGELGCGLLVNITVGRPEVRNHPFEVI